MGLLKRTARLASDAAALAAADQVQAAYRDPSSMPVVSPFSPDHGETWHRFVYDDVFGTEAPANTRAAAMRIPALARGRNLMVSTIAPFAFRALQGDEVVAPRPWFTACGMGQSPETRLAWTVDDLMFYGWSAWWLTLDAAGRLPLTASHLDYGTWSVTDDNVILVDEMPVPPGHRVVLIPGLHEGLLSYGRDAILDARLVQKIVRDRLVNPAPQVDLHQTGGEQLTPAEKADLKADWIAARGGANGGVAYTNEFIEAREMGKGSDSQLMIEARNAAAVEMARIVGVSASRVDATAPKASLNYETTTGRNQEFVDFDLALYSTPITARLSLDDVSPRGERVAFDLDEFTNLGPYSTGTPRED